MNTKLRIRKICTVSFIILLITEILIALFVDDAFIRPYGGDILVTILLCCMIRAVFPDRIKYLPLWVFVFAVFTETMQYFDILSILGLSHIPFLSILAGRVFSWGDIVCYGVGCVVFYLMEKKYAKVNE